jgi:hypothetical protein
VAGKGRLLEERAAAGGKSGCWRKERLLNQGIFKRNLDTSATSAVPTRVLARTLKRSPCADTTQAALSREGITS